MFNTKNHLILFYIYILAVVFRFVIYIFTPYWSGDEYVYKSIASGIWHFGRHGILNESQISQAVDLPNLLYPYLISPAFALGENFYIGIRLINALVINAAIFPCFMIAHKYLSKNVALIVSVLSISIPFVNIGAYAVTEVLFFPLFILAIYVAIESVERIESVYFALAFGVMSAILMTVRLNALIMIPAYFISSFLILFSKNEKLNGRILFNWAVIIFSFGLFYVGFRYLLDGALPLDFGFYSRVAHGSENPYAVVLSNPKGFLNLLAGHLTTLAIPFCIPIALLISNYFSLDKVSLTFANFTRISFIFSTALIVLAVIFTISVSLIDLGGLGRWHSRYYFYIYPFLIIICAYFAEKIILIPEKNNNLFVLVVILLLMTSFYFIFGYNALSHEWFGSIVDNMDVQWFRLRRTFYLLFIFLNLLLTYLWCTKSSLFSKAMLGFFVIWLIVANYGTFKVTALGMKDHYDQCGKLSQRYLEKHPGRFVIIGDSRQKMVEAGFWNVLIPEKSMIYTDINTELSVSEFEGIANYLIVNGKIKINSKNGPVIKVGECVIYETRL